MPVVAFLLLNLAIGVVAARASGAELRASPRPARQTRAFRGVAVFAGSLSLPASAALVYRLPDWAASYYVHAAALNSLALSAVVLAPSLLAVAGFLVGARWLREHRARVLLPVASVLALTAAFGLVVLRARVLAVGTLAQFTGGFGVVPLLQSDGVGLLGVAMLAWAAGVAHLVWWLARRNGQG